MLGPPPSKEEKQAAYRQTFKQWAKREPRMAARFDNDGNHVPLLSNHQFNVYWSKSKDELKKGNVEQGVSNVTVQGANSLRGNIRAKRVAEQMVAGRGLEPTRTEWIP